jgi:hypothetical protein
MTKSNTLESVSDVLNRPFPSADEIQTSSPDGSKLWLEAVEKIEVRIILANIMLGDEWKSIRYPRINAENADVATLDDFKSSVRWLDEFILESASKRPSSVPDFDFKSFMHKLIRLKSDLEANPALSLFYRRISSSIRGGLKTSLPHIKALPDSDSLRAEWYKLYTSHGVLTDVAEFQIDITSALEFNSEWIEKYPPLLLLLIAYTLKTNKVATPGFISLNKKLVRLAAKEPEFNAISKAISALS